MLTKIDGVIRLVESQKALADRLFPVARPEDDEDTDLRDIPPEQRRLHTETADLTVSSLHQYMTNGKIEIPEFQRGYVWTRTQASRLIESLVIQCPIPVVYFSQGQDGTLIVVDGNQRLLSIKLFLNDGFDLQGLTTYPELNGYSWDDLDPRIRDHVANRTIRCITILNDTHPQIKFDVFERLNTGSVKLNAQELRHGINHSILMKKLDELAAFPAFKEAVGIRSDKRMRAAELVLRYFAFRDDRQEYKKPLSGFLDAYSAMARLFKQEAVDVMAVDFQTTVTQVSTALGKLAFRIYGRDLKATSPFNAALYDAEMIGFKQTDSMKIKIGAYEPQELQHHVLELIEDERFLNSISRATSDEVAVKFRVEAFIHHLNEF